MRNFKKIIDTIVSMLTCYLCFKKTENVICFVSSRINKITEYHEEEILSTKFSFYYLSKLNVNFHFVRKSKNQAIKI